MLKNACTCLRTTAKNRIAPQVRAGLAHHVALTSVVARQYTCLHLPETPGPAAVRYERLGFGAWSLD